MLSTNRDSTRYSAKLYWEEKIYLSRKYTLLLYKLLILSVGLDNWMSWLSCLIWWTLYEFSMWYKWKNISLSWQQLFLTSHKETEHHLSKPAYRNHVSEARTEAGNCSYALNKSKQNLPRKLENNITFSFFNGSF